MKTLDINFRIRIEEAKQIKVASSPDFFIIAGSVEENSNYNFKLIGQPTLLYVDYAREIIKYYYVSNIIILYQYNP